MTFHPSYSYEDFVEGFRPMQEDGGSLSYHVQDGPFKLACDACAPFFLRDLSPGQILHGESSNYLIEDVTRETITLRSNAAGKSNARKIIPKEVIKSLIQAIEIGAISRNDLKLPKEAERKRSILEKLEPAADLNRYYLTDDPVLRALVDYEYQQRSVGSLFRVGDELEAARSNHVYQVCNVGTDCIIVQSKPNRADEVSEVKTSVVDFFTIEKVRSFGLPPEVFSIPGSKKDPETQQETKFLNPEDYGINPDDMDPPDSSRGENRSKRLGTKLRKYLGKLTGLGSTHFSNCSHYGAVYRRIKDPPPDRAPRKAVLLIDEINRSDLSRVFGELLSLIEPDKRKGAREHRVAKLLYSQELFSVPNELSIIGTMNTSDRSLAVVDFALRRRFEFVEIEPDPLQVPEKVGGVNVRELFQLLNHRVEACKSRDYRIGHSYLMIEKLDEARTAQSWPDDEEGNLKALAWVLRNQILPLLLEYFPDDWRKAHLVLGKNGLLEKQPESDLQDLDPEQEIIDLSNQSSFRVPEWWNPVGSQWNRARFLEEVKKNNPQV